ncbi:TRP1 [Candida metapsilosis]|uniref:N-(5'-phosphoribosyl)anthranilate isomerase n=1 Tax=Candida metapsilosis TaxID=273372 RepID=A0A8H7Z7L7_9ASCO|nr:TRP1 [Candida metapsilosis]
MKLIKICGVQTVEAAEVAMLNGADLIGCILVPNKSRTIDISTAKQIAQFIKRGRPQSISQIMAHLQDKTKSASFKSQVDYFEYVAKLILENGPFLVGVFQNQSRDEVLDLAKQIGLDFIQLHGSEPKLDFVNDEFGVIFRYVVPRDTENLRTDGESLMEKGVLSLPLLDSEQGGDGKTIDWGYIDENLSFTRSILAGGLSPDNLHDTKDVKNVLGYDVSSGVETDGKKDLKKIIQFIDRGKCL